jgi:hypothetical protein
MCDGPDVIWALRANPSQHAGYINGQNVLADGGAFGGTF